MNFGEIYTSLQSGVLDGLERDPAHTTLRQREIHDGAEFVVDVFQSSDPNHAGVEASAVQPAGAR